MQKIYNLFYFIIIILSINCNTIFAQCTFTSSVPYIQNFAGVSTASPLPQCWSSIGQAATSPSGTGFAYFNNTPSGSNYFFTNGIQLNAGTVYSVSIWYKTDLQGSTNWTSLSLLLSQSQSTTNLTNLVTVSPALSPVWISLSNTFVVNSSGIYYVATRGVSSGACCSYSLVLDDFTIEAPCQLNGNSFSITASSNTIFIGQSVTLTANGNPYTSYTWNTGATGSVIVVSPNSNVNFSALGINTITTCYANTTVNIQVNPIPIPFVFSNNNSICIGQSATLTAVAGSTAALNTFSWSNGTTNYSTVVSPLLTTTYFVIITNSYNCSGTVAQQIIVNPLPTITVIPSSTFICSGDEVSFALSGAKNFTWSSSTSTASGNANPIVKSLEVNELLIITGTDANGCSNTLTLNLNVNACAGLNEKSLEKRLYLFPNPTYNVLNLMGLNNQSSIELIDLKGMLVYSKYTNDNRLTINLEGLANGFYLLRIKSGNEVVEKKIIKD